MQGAKANVIWLYVSVGMPKIQPVQSRAPCLQKKKRWVVAGVATEGVGDGGDEPNQAEAEEDKAGSITDVAPSSRWEIQRRHWAVEFSAG
jgi:hypothetical protein